MLFPSPPFSRLIKNYSRRSDGRSPRRRSHRKGRFPPQEEGREGEIANWQPHAQEARGTPRENQIKTRLYKTRHAALIPPTGFRRKLSIRARRYGHGTGCHLRRIHRRLADPCTTPFLASLLPLPFSSIYLPPTFPFQSLNPIERIFIFAFSLSLSLVSVMARILQAVNYDGGRWIGDIGPIGERRAAIDWKAAAPFFGRFRYSPFLSRGAARHSSLRSQ